MAKVLGAKCRMCRRAGMKLFIKGDRCYTTKCAIVRRNYPPGQAGAKNSKPRLTGYGIQLREKQKAKQFYGVSETQFANYFTRANSKVGNTADIMVQFLEMRLDNVIYRLGWATSHAQARQFVGHGYFLVDGKKVNIPSYFVKPGSVITIKPRSEKYSYFMELLPKLSEKNLPSWLVTEPGTYSAKVVDAPKTEETVQGLFDMKSIIEFYSR
ncbi:MAG: 30S ribosomal protein S4 [bacterium]|nr:30S ribosomal protein S4 [bacterium]